MILSKKLDRIKQTELDKILNVEMFSCYLCLCNTCKNCTNFNNTPNCDDCKYVPTCVADYHVARCDRYEEE